MSDLLWWLALGGVLVAVAIDKVVGGTAALVAAVVVNLLVVLACMFDQPRARRKETRPWSTR